VGARATAELRLLDDVGMTAAHTGLPHPRQMDRPGLTPTAVHFSSLGEVPGVGPLTGSYSPARGCGAARLHVAVNGVAAAASPFAVTVIPRGTSSAVESFVMLDALTLTPGVVAVATIVAVDAFGCPRSGGGETFVATLTRLSSSTGSSTDGVTHPPLAPSSAAQLTAVVVDVGDGTYRARFAAPAEGRYALDVALRDPGSGALIAVAGSPVISDAVVDAQAGAWAPVVVPAAASSAAPAARAAPLAVWVDAEGRVCVLGGEVTGRSPAPLGEVWRVPGAIPDPAAATGVGAGVGADTFTFRRDVTFAGVPSVGHEVRVVVNTRALIAAGKMRPDCADASFRVAASGEVVAAWLDPQPGCFAEKTTFWLKASPAVALHLRYGAAGHAEVRAAPDDIFIAWAATSGDAADRTDYAAACPAATPDGCWSAATACGAAGSGAAPFSAVVAPSGVAASQPASGGGGPVSTVLRAAVGLGADQPGALTWPLSAAGGLQSYVLRAHVYDNDSGRAAHWMSPSAVAGACVAGTKPSRGASASAAPVTGIGVFTPATGGVGGRGTRRLGTRDLLYLP